MKTEDLLKILADAGLQEEEMKALLTDALASFDSEEEKQNKELDAEKETASKLLNVEL